MVTHLMDSFSKYQDVINAHVNYHEQGASFSSCGYAQVSLNPGVAYATSGPGATNLITGICNAYFDSIPVIFITGQVNTYESKEGLPVRQKGFQETDILSMVKNISKYSAKVIDAQDIRFHLEKAYHLSLHGRPGPVVLDIPMNIQRGDISPGTQKSYVPEIIPNNLSGLMTIEKALDKASRPCLLVGAGLRQSGMRDSLRGLVNQLGIPVISSMISIDLLATGNPFNFGFIGSYGDRYSNFILSKCDLLITLGTRLDVRQTGSNPEAFATNAQIIRIDVDEDELINKIHQDEIQIRGDVKEIIPAFSNLIGKSSIDFCKKFQDWIGICSEIKSLLIGKDDQKENRLMHTMSLLVPDNSIITTDVGQNQVWVSQSFEVKQNQQVLFSGGHGAMGYS
jgi:acetolactate synthase-1/2/3 large subunit